MRTIDRQRDIPASDDDVVSILSWNLLAPSNERDGLDWPTVRLPALSKWLQRFGAVDVACFQEVDTAGGALKDVLRLMAALGFDAVVQERGEFPIVNATFFKGSRFRLSWVEHRSRALLTGLAMVDGRELGVANVHLQAGAGQKEERQRVSQATSALRRLRVHASWCEVVCGDFNSSLPGDSAVTAILSEAGLSPAPGRGPTFIVKGYADMLDHICAGRALRPRAVLTSSPQDLRPIRKAGLPDEQHPSDHLPVAAVFHLAGGTCLPSLKPPACMSEAVREEWLQVLQSAPPPGSGKHANGEQRRLEKAFLGTLTPEQAEEVKAWSSAAAGAAAVMVKMAVGRAMYAAGKEGSCVRATFDPGGKPLAVLGGG